MRPSYSSRESRVSITDSALTLDFARVLSGRMHAGGRSPATGDASVRAEEFQRRPVGPCATLRET
jgi:hypothetical protein